MAEGLNRYETIIVTTATLGDEGNKTLVEKFKTRIEKHGTVESVDDWGKRRLAYPINKETEGYYTLINFESNPEFTAELDRRYQITDGILRTIIIKKDPRHEAAEKAAKERREAEKTAEPEKSIDVEAIAVETVSEELPAGPTTEKEIVEAAENAGEEAAELRADTIESIVDVAEEATEKADAEAEEANKE